ncbi:hypothetical protein H0H81_012162 [Sphagnurus paluster]|uniref:Uncharacterized protein n=1 Tax=Sphagnurus paluster TaxID=117069 RepID=A0A9P7FWR9_9AGAR|nr:hypothetical protein H0H81_012162 [Sphagnurus paluster]
MRSFSTVFFAAAALLASFTSAAPVAGVTDLTGVGQLPGALTGSSLKQRDSAIPSVSQLSSLNLPNGNVGPRHEGDLSFCDIIVDVQAKLDDASAKLKVLAEDKTGVKIDLVVNVITGVKGIFVGAVVELKAAAGHPQEFLLTLKGRVVAIVDVCRLFLSLITTVSAILSCAVRIVGTASLGLILPAIRALCVIYAEFLCLSFHLIDGLFIGNRSYYGPIVEIFATLQLTAIVDIFGGKF